MKIAEKWKKHPLTKQGVVELVPTEWLYQIRGQDVSPMTDLEDGSLVDMESLWSDIVSHGLSDPLIVRVGINNKKYRLESGNHRIQIFHQHNVKYVPTTVQIVYECGPNAPNVMTDATHNFNFPEKNDVSALTVGYVRPAAVFTELQSLIKQF